MTHVDWQAHTVWDLEPGNAKSRWATSTWTRPIHGTGAVDSSGPSGRRSRRQSVRRAIAQLAALREDRALSVSPSALALSITQDSTRLWTFAGDRANRSLAATL